MNGEEDIYQAVHEGNLDAIRRILDNNPEEAHGNPSEPPIAIAVYAGNLEALKILCEYGADINAKEGRGESMLHIAARANAPDIVRFLHARGLDLNAVDDFGFTPVWVACFGPGGGTLGFESLDALLELGADASFRDRNGMTPLQYVRQIGNVWIEEILLRHGVTE